MTECEYYFSSIIENFKLSVTWLISDFMFLLKEVQKSPTAEIVSVYWLAFLCYLVHSMLIPSPFVMLIGVQ